MARRLVCASEDVNWLTLWLLLAESAFRAAQAPWYTKPDSLAQATVYIALAPKSTGMSYHRQALQDERKPIPFTSARQVIPVLET